MAGKLTVVEALQAAIGDYNHWAEGGGKDYDPVRAYGDLRGIFYNKLMARMRETNEIVVSRFRYRIIRSDDLACVFSQSTNKLVQLVIPTTVSSQDRREFLVLLSEATKVMDYSYSLSITRPLLRSSTSIEDKMTNIVNELKSYKK